MKALLVYPEWPDTYWSFKHALPVRGQTVGLSSAGPVDGRFHASENLGKRLVDINIRPVTDADLKWADVVMISAMLVQKDGMLRTLARCRELGLRTVVGGPISSCMTDLALYADHVVVGEAEEIGRGTRRRSGTAEPPGRCIKRGNCPDWTPRRLPDLDLINAEILQRHGHPVFARLPFQLRILRHHRDLWPQAANQIARSNGGRARTPVCAQMARPDFYRGRQLHRQQAQGEGASAGDGANGTISTAGRSLSTPRPPSIWPTTTDLLQMMQDASFDRVFLGIETPAEESLKEAQKMQNTRRSLLDSVRRIQRYGMEVMAGFIVGFDNDPEDIFDRQVGFHPGQRDSAGHGWPAASPSGHATLSPPAKRRPPPVRRQREQSRLPSEFSARHGPAAAAGGLSLHPAAHLPSRTFITRECANSWLNTSHTRATDGCSLSDDCQALAQSILKQGIFSRHAFSYWRLFIAASTRYRQSFGAAIRLAIMGYHFQKLTEITLNRE